MTSALSTTPFIHPSIAAVTPLANAVAPRRSHWTPAELARLTQQLATGAPGTLRGLATHDPVHRWYTRLALTDEVEVWLIAWAPGQGTKPHDHGGASGALTVLDGTLTETYRDGDRAAQRHAVGAGQGSEFGPRRVHTVVNAGPVNATSVQAYSPPLLPMRGAALDFPGGLNDALVSDRPLSAEPDHNRPSHNEPTTDGYSGPVGAA